MGWLGFASVISKDSSISQILIRKVPSFLKQQGEKGQAPRATCFVTEVVHLSSSKIQNEKATHSDLGADTNTPQNRKGKDQRTGPGTPEGGLGRWPDSLLTGAEGVWNSPSTWVGEGRLPASG